MIPCAFGNFCRFGTLRFFGPLLLTYWIFMKIAPPRCREGLRLLEAKTYQLLFSPLPTVGREKLLEFTSILWGDVCVACCEWLIFQRGVSGENRRQQNNDYGGCSLCSIMRFWQDLPVWRLKTSYSALFSKRAFNFLSSSGQEK